MWKAKRGFNWIEKLEVRVLVKSHRVRQWIPIAFCICLLLPNDSFANGFGVGYSGGKTFITYFSGKLRAVVPLTLKDVTLDYRLVNRGLGSFSGFNLKGYLGLGTTVALDGKNNKAKGGKDGDLFGLGIGMAIRMSVGVETRLSRFPVTVYLEMNPDMNLDKLGDIKWKKFQFGLIYRF